jgi:ribose transport system permease protein
MHEPGALSRNCSRTARSGGSSFWSWCSSEVAGQWWSLSDRPSWTRQHAAAAEAVGAHRHHRHVGMTVVMINGNIDLSVGATLPGAIILLDSMTWPIFMPRRWATGRSRWPGSGAFHRLPLGADQRRDRLEDRGRRLHRHAGGDAGLPRPRLHVQRREPTYHLNWTMVDFAEAVSRPADPRHGSFSPSC